MKLHAVIFEISRWYSRMKGAVFWGVATWSQLKILWYFGRSSANFYQISQNYITNLVLFNIIVLAALDWGQMILFYGKSFSTKNMCLFLISIICAVRSTRFIFLSLIIILIISGEIYTLCVSWVCNCLRSWCICVCCDFRYINSAFIYDHYLNDTALGGTLPFFKVFLESSWLNFWK